MSDDAVWSEAEQRDKPAGKGGDLRRRLAVTDGAGQILPPRVARAGLMGRGYASVLPVQAAWRGGAFMHPRPAEAGERACLASRRLRIARLAIWAERHAEARP